jgi:chlorite dismutase
MTEKPKIDILERGKSREGSDITSDKRLFMQLQVFGGGTDETTLVETLEGAGLEAVLYKDINDPQGVGLLAMSEDPAFFTTTFRDVLQSDAFAMLDFKPEFTMLGRSYSSGYEPDLEDWLLQKPRRNARDPNRPWAIWYPLRRTGAFAALPDNEQKSILREHGGIGRLYGDADLAHDIRLACHGLDALDNEFVIGLIGRELYPLSHCVQSMRKTRQTSQYIQTMGPFFVGYAIWQSPLV